MKEHLLNNLTSLVDAVEAEDVTLLLNCMKSMGFSGMSSGPICDYAHDLLVKDISDYVSKKGVLKVERTGEYGIKTEDYYRIDGAVLMRNGSDAKWSSIGKLYQAYKKIHCDAAERPVKSEYDIKADNLAERLGLQLCINSKRFGSMSWDEGKTKRWIFNLSLVKGKQIYTFEFGQSIAAKSSEPTMYDVLAIITKYNPGSFENFCSEFGYNSDSIRDFKIYNGVVDEWREMSRMFTSEELELLQEIQ